MSSSSKTGSKRSSSTKVKKSTTKKTSTKVKKDTTTKRNPTAKKAVKTKTVAKSVKEKTVELTVQNTVIEKTLANIERLGNQTFALSPFSQYYDDWLNSLHQTLAEFETVSNIKTDKTFTQEREQALSDIQTAFTEQRTQETTISKTEKTLHKINQDIKDIDEKYAKEKHELHNKQNTNIQKLTPQIKTLEETIATQEKTKFGFFQFSAKKTAAKKLEQTKQELKNAKTQLETTTQDFTSKQNELHDNYVTKKQAHTTKADALRKEIEQLEIDTSIKARKEICTRLNNSINELIKRQTVKPGK